MFVFSEYIKKEEKNKINFTKKNEMYKDVKMAYGKHKGLPIDQVSKENPEYLLWLDLQITKGLKEEKGKQVTEENLKFGIAVNRFVAQNKQSLVNSYIGKTTFPFKRYKGKTFDEISDMTDDKAVQYKQWLFHQVATKKDPTSIFHSNKEEFEHKNSLVCEYITNNFI